MVDHVHLCSIAPPSLNLTQSMPSPFYPSLYQINTRVWLTAALARPRSVAPLLMTFPNLELDRLAALGFDWIWLLQRLANRAAARASYIASNTQWRHEFDETLPDLTEEDIAGSGFAIAGYTVHHEPRRTTRPWPDFATDSRQRGLKLMLDFVPNHTARRIILGSKTIPDYYISGTDLDLAHAIAELHGTIESAGGGRILAIGRDPISRAGRNAQLNYGKPATQQAMIGELLKIAGQCDGVRCDMAMLILPEVFERTWGIGLNRFGRRRPRSPRAVPGLHLHGRGLLGPGMDAPAAGIRLRLRQTALRPLARAHARQCANISGPGLEYQNKPARFLENHDEPRTATFLARRSRRPRQSSRSCRPACVSSTRDNSKDAKSGSRPI